MSGLGYTSQIFQPIRTYERLRKKILREEYQPVAEELRKLRQDHSPLSNWSLWTHQLLNLRLSLRKGHPSEAVLQMDPQKINHPFFRAETYLLRAYWYYHQGAYHSGVKDFLQAAQYFRQIHLDERELIALYNALVGMENEDKLSTAEHLSLIKNLEKKAQQRNSPRVLGLIYRQKSFLYLDQQHFYAGLEFGEKAMSLLELSGPKSDFDLACLQSCYCALKVNDKKLAFRYFDRVLGPVDRRVEFPHSFIKSLLFEKKLSSLSPGGSSRFWKKLWQNENSQVQAPSSPLWVWNSSTGELTCAQSQSTMKFKLKSLEGRTLRLVGQGPITKALLTEQLWPDLCPTQTLDNRLHRLVSRINKKASGLIQFDGSYYCLGQSVQVLEPT